MRLVLAGTPAVALPALDALVASRHEVVAVVTRPDARSGRGRALHPSPVKHRALDLGLEVLTPRTTSDPEFLARLRDLEPRVCPVVAYGALLRADALAIPPEGWVNLHFSLLPAWRGAAPVQHAIMAGDDVTGASTFRIEEGLDTGPVFGRLTETIHPDDTAGTLLDRLAVAGAELLVATIDGIDDGSLTAVAQSGEVSLAPKLTTDDARVRWTDPSFAVDRRIRGCTPDPGAWTVFRGDRVRLGPVGRSTGGEAPALRPGELFVTKNVVVVGTATAPVLLGWIRPSGRREMSSADWARGARIEPGECFGNE